MLFTSPLALVAGSNMPTYDLARLAELRIANIVGHSTPFLRCLEMVLDDSHRVLGYLVASSMAGRY